MNYSSAEIWFMIITGGILTFFIRLSFIQFANEKFMNLIKEILTFMPPSILAALVFSGIFEKGAESISFSNIKIYGAVVAFVIALRFKNTILTIFSGLLTIFLINYIMK